MKNIFLITLISLIFVCLSFQVVLAACPNPASGTDQGPCLDNPLGKTENVNTLIGNVINGILGIVGSIALVMFIFGGFTWMTAAGNQERVTKGKNILIWATIGIIVIFMSYALVTFVFTNIGATPTPTG